MDNIFYGKPVKEDGKHIFDLVKSTKILDLNSQYLYLLQTTHFKDYTCIAKDEEKVVGFVSSYTIPDQNDKLFIWQVGVNKNYRGKNIALNMIENLLRRSNLSCVNEIHTTISPSNQASIRLFEKVTQKYGLSFEKEVMFKVEDFNDAHEDEVLYKIKLKK